MSNTSPELYESRPVSLQLSIAPPGNTLSASSAELSLKLVGHQNHWTDSGQEVGRSNLLLVIA